MSHTKKAGVATPAWSLPFCAQSHLLHAASQGIYCLIATATPSNTIASLDTIVWFTPTVPPLCVKHLLASYYRDTLSVFAPENLVSRNGFGSPVPRQPAHLHTQAKSGAYLRGSSRVPRRRRPFPHLKPSYVIVSVPSLSGHTIMPRWRSLPRVRRHRANKSQCSSERVLRGRSPWTNKHAPLFSIPTSDMEWVC